MVPPLALLPSPLLGPVGWEPVAGVLRDRGLPVRVPGLPAGFTDPEQVLAGFLAELRGAGDLVLVPHSNAGLYAPALAAELDAVGTVFVDAALPGPGTSTRLAPPGFAEFLQGLADEDGLLPPWTRWWAESELEQLFPDPDWRRRVQAGEPRLPLSYFEAEVAVPDGWAARPCAYLAFGGTYAEETDRARRLRWPVEVLDGGHLHLLHEPAAVADAVVGLLRRLGVGQPSA